MVAGCELWRQTPKKQSNLDDDNDDGLEWARRKLRENNPDYPPPLVKPSPGDGEGDAEKGDAEGKEEANGSVLKIRVDQSWNVRLLWEGRVKELLVSAGVGLGPGSFSSSSWANASSGTGGGAQSAGGGTGAGGLGGASYWRGVGVSVLYSS